jgi:proteasome assembly chaperone (PAC2) family protein
MDEIEYKVVKAIFTVDLKSKIEQINISEKNLEFNEKDLEEMINKMTKENNTQNNSNPLFTNPNNNNNNKTRIRI